MNIFLVFHDCEPMESQTPVTGLNFIPRKDEIFIFNGKPYKVKGIIYNYHYGEMLSIKIHLDIQ